MSKSAYRTIAILLAVSLVSFLTVQALWIRSSVRVAEDEIHRSVADALSRTAKKLETERDLLGLKERIVLISHDSAAGVGFRMVHQAEDSVKVRGTIGHSSSSMHHVKLNVPDFHTSEKMKVMVLDSEIHHAPGHEERIVIKKSFSSESGEGHLDTLMNKMFAEIRHFQASPFRKLSADTMKKIISVELAESGIAEQFEFGISAGKSGDIVCRSAGFDSSKISGAFSQAIFRDNVLKTSDRLHLQFPSTASMLFSKMKSLIFAGGFFAFFICGAFIYTLRLISKQKRLSEIKTDFINNMTHELKTPIATISVAADALNNDKVRADSEKLNYYTSVVKEENNKMHRNVEKVLQLALTDKENFKPHFSPVTVDALVQKCISNFRLLFVSGNIAHEYSPAGESVQIEADAFHLENAINNLIDNAVKYSGENATVKLKSELKNDKVFISVEDNGVGMSDELKMKVFDKFYRGQRGNLHDVKGFGIGLSYVYNVVKAHGGSIKVDSEPGRGSKFVIIIPVKK